MSDSVFANVGPITDTSAVDLIAAQGANVKIYVTTAIVTNSHATVGTLVTIKDDSPGGKNIICQGYAAAAGGGFAISLPQPRDTVANGKLIAVCETTGANVYVSVTGFKSI